jgi:hypothetical protein
MKMIMTLAPAPLAALELDDLQAVSGGNVTGDPAKDTTVTRATPSIEDILRREAENKLGRQGDKK